MRAVRTTGVPDAPIIIADAAVPTPAADQALVRVHAISLNPGELRRSRRSQPGNPIGWDFAGTVERAAANGTGPAAGARVVGFVGAGAWADYVAAPTHQLGVLPPGVAFHDAATLPGTGGVGLFALQLARRAGATVTTVIRNAANDVLVRGHGAHTVVVGTTADAGHETKYDLILESLGGESLGAALSMLRPEGTVVSFGQTVHSSTTFASDVFYATGGATLYGFILFHEAEKVPVVADLEHLAALVGAGELTATIDATLPFDRIADAVSLRSERGLPGKIVVTLRD
jgi:NADPH:quinone reductase-like Zn-dependent oxidoreductase